MQLAPLQGHGWTRGRDGNLDIYWDTEENRHKVESRIDLLMKECSLSLDVPPRDVDARRMVKLVVQAASVSTARTLKKGKKHKK